MADVNAPNAFQFGGGKYVKYNKVETNFKNVRSGLFLLSANTIQTIVNERQKGNEEVWNLITGIAISGSWICILHPKLTEKDSKILLKTLNVNNLIYEDKTYAWATRGYRKDFGSNYTAIGPWSKKKILYDPLHKSNVYDIINIALPKQ